MKKAYTILLYALCTLALAWALPWLYDLVFPQATADPFVSYSPVADCLIVSERTDDGQEIYLADSTGRRISGTLTKEERDSLLPQMYYTQLMARQAMPDSLLGEEMSVANLRHQAWVFTSSPRDVNKVSPGLYPIMESMPVRIDLEDPKEVFSLDGEVRFIDMATNEVNDGRSERFNAIFESNGFSYPVKSYSANITARKGYDEGYLFADNSGSVYHVKMQAGRPYMAKVSLPDSVKAEHVFILENPDRRLIGLMVDSANHLYAIEHSGYKAVRLPVGTFDPSKQRAVIVKDIFNWVVKITDSTGARWTVIDSRDFSPKGSYQISYQESIYDRIAGWIFPFTFSVTSLDDCYVKPRFANFSWHALVMNALLAIIVGVMMRRRGASAIIVGCGATLVFGIYFFVPLILLQKF